MKGYRHLTLVDRFTIQEGREKGLSLNAIAYLLGVSKPTVCREIKRNSNQCGEYHALGADHYAKGRLTNGPDCKKKLHGALEAAVIEQLERGLSPEQISGRLKLEGRESVCHETIYKWIYRNFNRSDLSRILRRFRTRKRRKNKRQNRFLKINSRISIDHRPESVALRKRIGHWERDSLEGQRSTGYVLAFVERRSRFTLLKKTTTKYCDEANDITEKTLKENKRMPFLSLTNDNGPEFGNPDKLSEKIKIPIYFTHPNCPWERGSIENLNGLLRQYLPKKTSFKSLTQKELDEIQDTLNTRPRKNLNYRTPHEIMFKKKIKLFRGNKYYRDEYKRRENESFEQLLKMTGF